MKKIILDTNFLIDCLRFKIDFLEEIQDLIREPFQIFVLSATLKELEKISKLKIKESKYAKLALKLVKEKKFLIIETACKNTDKAILELANKDSIIATNDKELRNKLRKKGIKTIYLRAKKYLEIG